jgi:hypothetical protein
LAILLLELEVGINGDKLGVDPPFKILARMLVAHEVDLLVSIGSIVPVLRKVPFGMGACRALNSEGAGCYRWGKGLRHVGTTSALGAFEVTPLAHTARDLVVTVLLKKVVSGKKALKLETVTTVFERPSLSDFCIIAW